MEIRFTSPVVYTNDSAKIIAQMEKLGFHVNHEKEITGDNDVTTTTMKDDAGHPMAVVENARFTTPFSGIRLIVDNLCEALDKLTAVGYMNLQAGSTNTGTSYATLLRSPEGIFVSITEHTK